MLKIAKYFPPKLLDVLLIKKFCNLIIAEPYIASRSNLGAEGVL